MLGELRRSGRRSVHRSLTWTLPRRAVESEYEPTDRLSIHVESESEPIEKLSIDVESEQDAVEWL